MKSKLTLYSENEEIARLLHAKAKTPAAFGACSMEAGIPGLANVTTKEDVLRFFYKDPPSTVVVEEGVYPQTHTSMPEGEIEIPEMWITVRALHQVVDVDVVVPGCPSPPNQI